MQQYIVRKIGSNRGAPRVYLDTGALVGAGFAPGKTYKREVDTEKQRITLTIEANGSFVVSRKEKNGHHLPVIDINSSEVLKPFEGMEAVRIVIDQNRILILPIASEAKRVERLRRLKEHLAAGEVTTAGISFGGGVLDHAAHAGLEQAGIASRLALANEIDEGLLEHARTHNDVWSSGTIGIAAPMQELVQDDAAMSRLPRIDVLAAGIPCSGASQAGKSKRGISMMEEHPEVGHLAAAALMVINRIQPAVVVIENVPQYSDSASACIIRNHPRDSGYNVQETQLNAADFSCLEARKRWFLVATTRGIEMDLFNLEPVVHVARKIGDILEPIGPDAEDWRTFDYLKTKEVRDAAKGNCFSMQTITPESSSCPTIRKGYAKGGSTDPLLVHPTHPDLLRPLTVTEHARIKQVPEKLVEGLSKTDGHILLGQGIAYAPVKALFHRIGQCLRAWQDSVSEQASQSVGYSLSRATG